MVEVVLNRGDISLLLAFLSAWSATCLASSQSDYATTWSYALTGMGWFMGMEIGSLINRATGYDK